MLPILLYISSSCASLLPPPVVIVSSPCGHGLAPPNWVVLSPPRLLKQLEKPTSLDLTFSPPTIMVTANNMSEAESDLESTMSPIIPKQSGGNNLLGVPGSSGMCYLSPFSIVARTERTTSESNLSSSGYSSMASPGPSRCGSSNPLCSSEAEDPSNGKYCSENVAISFLQFIWGLFWTGTHLRYIEGERPSKSFSITFCHSQDTRTVILVLY